MSMDAVQAAYMVSAMDSMAASLNSIAASLERLTNPQVAVELTPSTTCEGFGVPTAEVLVPEEAHDA